MLLEQQAIAEEVKEFLKRWGLKSCFVAEVCAIHPNTLSRFVNHRIVLSDNQLVRLRFYMTDYEMRNS